MTVTLMSIKIYNSPFPSLTPISNLNKNIA
jgi:hypothetical protein